MRGLWRRLARAFSGGSREEALARSAPLMSPETVEREIASIVESRARRGALPRPSSIAPFYGSVCAMDLVLSALKEVSGDSKQLRARLFRASVVLDALSSLRSSLYSESPGAYATALDSILEHGSTILAYGYGELLVESISSVRYKVGKVWSLEIEPLGAGKMLAHSLKKEGLESGYASSIAKNSLVRDSDVILVRVYAATLEKELVVDPGGYGLLRLSRLHGKPAYAFSENFGLLGCATRAKIYGFMIRAGDSSGLLELPAFDTIPHTMFSGVVYEGGLAKDDIGRLLDIYRDRIESLALRLAERAARSLAPR